MLRHASVDDIRSNSWRVSPARRVGRIDPTVDVVRHRKSTPIALPVVRHPSHVVIDVDTSGRYDRITRIDSVWLDVHSCLTL